MMKKITLYAALLFLGMLQGYCQVALGDGTITNQHVPFEPSFGYSYGQSIYLANEISASGNITSLQWYYSGNGNSDLANSQELTIYLLATNKTSFDSNTDWESTAGFSEVYFGGITATDPGWVTIELTVPFPYNGTDNLIVAVKEAKPGKDANSDDFRAFAVPDARTIAFYSNTIVPDTDNPPAANDILNYVPNIVFGGITQACPTPQNLTVSAFTENTATINWDAPTVVPSGGTQYYVSESDSTPAPTATPTGSVTSGNTATITEGLLPGTKYYVWVRDVCDGTPGGWSMFSVTFTTACTPIDVFNENFETTEPNTLPSCWSSIMRGEGIDESASVMTVPYQTYEGDRALSLYNGGGAEDADVILISPNLNPIAATPHRLRFFARGGGDGIGSGVQVGTLNTTTNSATFTPFGDPISTTADYAEYIVDFTGYTGTDTYIGLRMIAPYQYFEMVMDNIVWEPAPACMDVTLVAVPVVTENSATVTWVPQGTETHWDIVVGPTTTNDPGTLTPILSASTLPTIQLTDLQAATPYKTWVRSVCDAGVGAWIGPVNFTTSCLPVNALNENFDTVDVPNLPDCWTKIVTGSVIADIYTYITETSSLPNAVKFSGNDSQSANLILVSPKLGNLQNHSHRLKFKARGIGALGGSPGSLEIGTLNTNTNSAEFTTFDTVGLNGTSTEYIIDFTEYSGDDTHIGLRMHSPNFSEIYVDDIKWEPNPSCPDVSGIIFPNLTSTSAEVTWESDNSVTHWEVAYGSASATDPETVTSVTTDQQTLLLDGLEGNTAYNVWVRTVCDNGFGAWIGPVPLYIAAPDCVAMDSFYENFDNAATIPNCWLPLLTGPTLEPAAAINILQNFSDSNSGPNSVSLSSSGSDLTENAIILISPELTTLGAGTTHELKFYAENAGELEIGTLDSHEDGAVFTPFHNVPTTTGWNQYTVAFSEYTGTDTFIGIRLKSLDAASTAINLDDIAWESPLSIGGFDNNKLSYYPNPVRDILTLSYNQNISNISVFNLLGQKVIENTVNSATAQVDLSKLASGSYIVKITSDTMTKTIKVIKE